MQQPLPLQTAANPKYAPPTQTVLDHCEGLGVHHIAIKTNDIISTLRQMAAAGATGGFELLPPPPPSYYDAVWPKMVGSAHHCPAPLPSMHVQVLET
jgi:4-hydroxyphenylpyruvate dioxygenase-like putative hemolysin